MSEFEQHNTLDAVELGEAEGQIGHLSHTQVFIFHIQWLQNIKIKRMKERERINEVKGSAGSLKKK